MKSQDLIERPGDTEADEVEPVPSVEPAAIGRPEVPREAVPGTAAQLALITCPARPRAPITRRTPVTVVPAILHPFPHVARRIENTNGVRLETPHRCRTLIVPLAATAVAVRLVGADVVAPRVFGRASRPRQVFPLCFAQKDDRPCLSRATASVRTSARRPRTR